MVEIELYYLAHARSGDKGNISNIAIFPYDANDFELINEALNDKAISQFYGSTFSGPVEKYSLPLLPAFNLVFHHALTGGVTDSLYLDTHGKSRSSIFLSLPVMVPQDHPAIERKKNLCAHLPIKGD